MTKFRIRRGKAGKEPRAGSGRHDEGDGSDVYVCYSQKDKASADSVVAHLEGKGISCFIAPRDIAPGLEWAAAIVEAIDSCQCLVVIVSNAADESRHVIRELERAVSGGVLIIPFRIENVEPTGAMNYFLHTGSWLDAFSPPLGDHLNRLAALVSGMLGPTAEKLERVEAPPADETSVDHIVVDVEESDALDFAADALALKHASGAFYGVDKAVAARYLDRLGLPFPMPGRAGDGEVVESRRCIAAKRIAVIGVPDLFDFGHREIRRFASDVLRVLFSHKETTRHLALTIQGAALRLDEGEVLESQLGGLIDALDDGYIPPGLERITFVERDPIRAHRMRETVQRVLPDGSIPIRLDPVPPAPPTPDDSPTAGSVPFEPYRGSEPYLFVSYAHSDDKAVSRHLQDLHARGYRIWYDAGIVPGANWEDSIAHAIAGADQVLVCLSRSSVGSQHVRDEISFALNKKKPLVAAYLEQTDLPPGLELRIGSKQALMLHSHPPKTHVSLIASALEPRIGPR